ncbi:hypothetical protein A6R68_05888 [Neotoma lepida]|uniref:Uncharacterized protein n=1 Tax=Neotoma lepida TaxID=56216 RepID=A0A1A6GH24_NEOLE|nr:hypothetical protein A6R68_05888 [Neotoma lepida]
MQEIQSSRSGRGRNFGLGDSHGGGGGGGDVGDLIDLKVGVDLGMTIMGVEEDLKVAILEVVLVMEEEDMVLEDLDIATRVGTMEVVMATMEEEIMELEITMILEIMTSHLLNMVQ